jgi:hypothetical protein
MEKKVKLKHKLTNKKNIIKNMKISNKKKYNVKENNIKLQLNTTKNLIYTKRIFPRRCKRSIFSA